MENIECGISNETHLPAEAVLLSRGDLLRALRELCG